MIYSSIQRHKSAVLFLTSQSIYARHYLYCLSLDKETSQAVGLDWTKTGN